MKKNSRSALPKETSILEFSKSKNTQMNRQKKKNYTPLNRGTQKN